MRFGHRGGSTPSSGWGLRSELIEAVKAHGMNPVDWNASICDAEYYEAPSELLYANAVESSKGHDRVILLAHDTTTKSTTADALKDIIKYFKSRNYTFATL